MRSVPPPSQSKRFRCSEDGRGPCADTLRLPTVLPPQLYTILSGPAAYHLLRPLPIVLEIPNFKVYHHAPQRPPYPPDLESNLPNRRLRSIHHPRLPLHFPPNLPRPLPHRHIHLSRSFLRSLLHMHHQRRLFEHPFRCGPEEENRTKERQGRVEF